MEHHYHLLLLNSHLIPASWDLMLRLIEVIPTFKRMICKITFYILFYRVELVSNQKNNI